MRIVILGYTGLIGKSVLEYLSKDNSLYLVCVGRNIRKKPYKNTKIKYCRWDFTTFKKSNLIFLNKANVIINCVGKNINTTNNFEKLNVFFIKKLIQHIKISKTRTRLIHLSSVSVYDSNKKNISSYKVISENSRIKPNDSYSKSKLDGDIIIQKSIKKSLNKNFSYTILRISNVVSNSKNSNLFKFVLFSLKSGFWIKSYDNIMFNFIDVRDVVQAIILIISKLKISKNKIYILSDDCKQSKIYKNYQNLYKKKIIEINIPISLIKFLIYFIPLPKKVVNFMLLISNRIFYSNKKIKYELNFKANFSLHRIKFLNGK
tara:strand:+ start:2208 stop:3161 length:954 start_codon:yes stop_codon:yes gene_type:complete